jgi:hypothetical protein
MWKVVYVASSERLASSLHKILVQNGLLVSMRRTGTDESGPVEILVPNSEAADALELINTSLCRWGRVSR